MSPRVPRRGEPQPDPSGAIAFVEQVLQIGGRRPSFDGIAWTSSLDGGLGEGAQVLAALSAGDHMIMATMLDAAAEVQVSVG